MRLQRYAVSGYLAAMCAFLLAAPYFAPGGGYTVITACKAAVYAGLTLPFLLLSLPAPPPLRDLFRDPARLLAWGMLFFCLLSALCSPWKGAAFAGGSRREGFFHLALYLLSFLLLSCREIRHRRALTAVFACAVLLLDGLCLLQLAGRNPLGLYPPGMRWADANVRYAGAYLGTVGNTAFTGAVLSSAAALFFLCLLREGSAALPLLLPLLLSAGVLGAMDVTAPLLALLAVMLLAPVPFVHRPDQLCRWAFLAALTAAALLWGLLPAAGRLGLLLAAWAAAAARRVLRPEGDVRVPALCLTGLLCLGALAAAFFYRGWYTPLREAGELLRGRVTEEMGSGRVYIWKQVLSALPGRLWLGTGPDTLALRGLPPYSFDSPAMGKTVTLSIDAAHCEVLHTLVCCGLPAAACHLGLFLCAALRFFRRRGALCAGAALCYGIQALFGISMCASAPLFWILLALSLAKGGDPPGDTDEQK